MYVIVVLYEDYGWGEDPQPWTDVHQVIGPFETYGEADGYAKKHVDSFYRTESYKMEKPNA